MTDLLPDGEDKDPSARKRVCGWVIVRSVVGSLLSLTLVLGLLTGIVALHHPDTPLPSEWNPTVPLAVSDPVTPLTHWKLRRALSDRQLCLDVLDEAAVMTPEPDIENTENCYIRNRVSLSSVGNARIDPIETTCAVALRLAMWEEHGIQRAAIEHLGTSVSVVRQIGSYNCRPIRTTQGPSNRWSTHATAEAIDITGFDLSDGRRIRLLEDWDDGTEVGAFLRAVQESACTWFVTTLGPDYNALHADHFHLQSRGWGACR
ncbi:MAG: extensin family protein [Pseudomonadota bacterium]